MTDKPEIPEVPPEPERREEMVPPAPEQGEETVQPAPDQGEAKVLSERTSVWSLMLGVLTNPGATLAQVARERRVGQAALIVAGLNLFVAVISMLAMMNAKVELTMDGPEAPLGKVLGPVALHFTLVWAIMIAVLQVVSWFSYAATYNLLGELMGERPDGRAMLAALGFAQMPSILIPILVGLAVLLGLWTLPFLFGLVIGIWILVLDVVAIRSALQTSTGKAALIFFTPWVVGIGLAVVFFVFMLASLFPLISTMPTM
ncbi:MAG TPA: Yip1 family protein [Symbiobacteriaceae bacterium]